MSVEAGWPRPLWPLVQTFGPAAVWVAGVSALGFPPTWADRPSQYEAVRSHLYQES